jgi:hypothetical protein
LNSIINVLAKNNVAEDLANWASANRTSVLDGYITSIEQLKIWSNFSALVRQSMSNGYPASTQMSDLITPYVVFLMMVHS